ncbi:MAG TPA: GAF domain-containing protein [Vicinamibacteria bacterium]|nr:GAF domain-containing protein [Vicinamibacteria bacterium]
MPGRILVVDDDAAVRRTLVTLLEHNGYPALAAESGIQALDMLSRESDVDLVILDVVMPKITGFETCVRIRKAHGPSLPVIMLTAFGDAQAMRQALEAGADDFLIKPVDTPALILKMRAFLRFKSLHDEIAKNREEAQARARDLALLHEIGRDWSLVARPEEFNRMVTQRLASLIGAPICLVVLYDRATRTLAASLPAFGLPDEVARRVRSAVDPERSGLWSLRSGRPYLSNDARSDPRLVQDVIQLTGVQSVVLVPLISEGVVLGLLAAADKPGGFTDEDAQLLSIFAGPAATFVRSRQIFDRQRRHAERLERVSTLLGEMAGTDGRTALLELTVTGIHRDLDYDRVAFHTADEAGGFPLECDAGRPRPSGLPLDAELLRWALRGAAPLPAMRAPVAAELAVPVRAGEDALGVLTVLRSPAAPFDEEETNLLSALAGQLAVALQKAESTERTERLARQMETLYDVGLETSALRDLRALFVQAAAEAGRLIQADHTSVLRLHEAEGVLRLFVAWGKEPTEINPSQPSFKLGEGIAGHVAQDLAPIMVNDTGAHKAFVERAHPMSRLLCLPLTYYDPERGGRAVFGVINASRRPGRPRFTQDDLDYVTRFAAQLSIAAANSMAFGSERQRSEQLALVNALLREIAGNLSRERILETAVRRIHEAFRYPAVMIAVPEQDGTVRIAAAAGKELPPVVGRRFEGTVGVAGRCLRERRTAVVQDVAEDPDYLALVPATRSEVAVPIVSAGEAVAVLTVESDERRGFDRGQVITLETLADGIAIILRNAELFQALERTNAQLVEMDRMKSELVNIVAHDFRSPLAGVLGFAELLEWKTDAPPQERAESVKAIIQAATHMADLVEKTLKTTRLETGQFAFEFGLVDLAETVREVLRRFRADEAHPIRAVVPDDPIPCWADAGRVAEVVENLLSNAVKYSPEGGAVDVSVRREGESVAVSVADLGIGLDPSELHRLFRPFSRLQNAKAADIEGSGLGLYICDRIVKAHGGRLQVEARPGGGSVFSFSLPVFGAAAQTRAPFVLVGAADEATRREVRRVAEELGYGSHEVADGVEAVETALRLVPAAVVLDRVLPRLGAAEIAERLKENAATAGIPIVALSAEADLGERSKLFSACIPKPVERDVLSAALSALAREKPHGSLTGARGQSAL